MKFNKEAVEEIKRIQKELVSSDLFVGKLTEEENLHLTLKFLGEIDEEKAGDVRERLRNVKLKKFSVKLGELGVFSPSFIKIIWIKLDNCDELQNQIDKTLEGLFEKERRFMGHLTIARVKNVKDKPKLFEFLGKIKVKKVEFEVESFELMKSELFPEGPKYSVFEEFELF